MRYIHLFSIIIFASSLFATFTMKAQTTTLSTPTLEENNTSFREFWINIGGGPRVLKTTTNSITTRYVDDSPSADEFYSTLNIKDKYTRPGLNFEIGFGQKMGLSHTIFADVAFGEIHSTFSGYSVGWELPIRAGKSNLLIRPGFNIMYGNTGCKLGRMENEGLFIQINQHKFYDNYLNVRLSENLLAYGPRLDVNFLLAKKYGITASLAYDFTTQSNKGRVFFSTPYSEDRPENAPSSTMIRLPDDNLTVNYGENRNLTQMPYDYGGLRCTLAVMLTKQR